MARPEQAAILHKGVDVAKDLIQKRQHLGEDYRRRTICEIIENERLLEAYDIPLPVAKVAVYLAIHGHHNGRPEDNFDGLITDPQELEALAAEHRRKGGETCRDYGMGIFSRTPAQHRQDSAKETRTPQQHSLDSRLAAQQCNLSKGLTLWTPEEEHQAYELAVIGGWSHAAIAAYLNREHHDNGNGPVRTATSVRSKVFHLHQEEENI